MLMDYQIELYEKVFAEMSRVCFLLQNEFEDRKDFHRCDKVKEFFSILSIEEMVDLYELMELL